MKNAKYLVAIAAFATLAWVGFSAFTTEPNGLKSKQDLATREAARNEFPFMVTISFDGQSQGLGVLISPEWVLTTASGMVGNSFADLVFGVHNTTDYLLGNASEAAAVKIRVNAADFDMHGSWNANNLNNNVALIHLPAPLTLSPAIQPISTVDWTANWVGQAVKGVGWGSHLDNNVLKYSPIPQVVDVSIVAMQQAITQYGKAYDPSTQVAAQGTGYTTTVLVTTGAGATKLVGFLNEGTHSGGLSVYSRLDHFSQWIEQNSGVGFN